MKLYLMIYVCAILSIWGCSQRQESQIPLNEIPQSDVDDYLILDFDEIKDIQNSDTDFSYIPVGQLIEGSGIGIKDNINYSPNMVFPLKTFPVYCNSQVYGFGGLYGPQSRFGWKDQRNYSYPWVDNFCEKRTKFSCCFGKKGHQGQDIRPATYHDLKYEAVACESGLIAKVGSYSIKLMASDGLTEYRYLHLDKKTLKVAEGDSVIQGQSLGYVSNEFGGVATTIHLHFEIRKAIKYGESDQPKWRPVSPYIALVESYKRLLVEEENRSIILNDSVL